MPHTWTFTDDSPGFLDSPAAEACQTRRDRAARLAALATRVWLLPVPAADRVTLSQRPLTGRLLPTRAAPLPGRRPTPIGSRVGGNPDPEPSRPVSGPTLSARLGPNDLDSSWPLRTI